MFQDLILKISKQLYPNGRAFNVPFGGTFEKLAAILQKMRYPGTIIARQHYTYVESQLQLAGFDAYVYENRFFEGGQWITKTPFEVSGLTPNPVRHATSLQHGQTQHGGGPYPKIVNSLSQRVDNEFSVGSNYRSTFFIGGATLGSKANINYDRISEFRQLVLKLKPAQTVAFVFLNFTPLVPVYDYGDDYGNDYTLI